MVMRDLRYFGDPVLKTVCDPVTTFDKKIESLVTDLMDGVKPDGRAGLAAPQIGVGLRVFVYDTGDAAGHVVNPQWSAIGTDEQVGPEGCLSIPGVRYDVRRALRVRVTGVDSAGAPVEFEAEDLLARCVQHETDHLDGVLFVNRLEPEDRKDAMRTIRESDWFRAGVTVRESSGVGGGH